MVRFDYINTPCHSEHLLRRLQRRIAEKRFSRDSSALYFCESVNGESVLKKLELDLYENILNWPQNFFGDEMDELAAMSEANIKFLCPELIKKN